MTPSTRRTLRLWVGSFLVIAVVLFCYFGAPVLPVLIAGVLTLAVTLIRRSA